MNFNTNVATVETLPVITWQNKPVITTDLLASVYDAKPIQIQQNFKNNASRFVEGVHYFKLTDEDLKDFKRQLDNIELPIVHKFSAHLMLWTERGTVRHAKILDTDNAWLVQDKLEEYYFAKAHISTNPLQLPSPRAKTKVKGGLELHQQDAINDLINERMLTVPQERRGAMKIRIYSAINTKFSTKGMKDGYKNIEPGHFDNIISLIARLPLDEKLLLTFTPDELTAIIRENQGSSKYLEGEVMPKPEPQQDAIHISINGGMRMMTVIFEGKVDKMARYLVQVEQNFASIHAIPQDAIAMTEPEFAKYMIEERGYIVLKETEFLSKLRA